ncbi:MAG: amino acid ABC transporter permease [Nitrospinaceae bacterium]
MAYLNIPGLTAARSSDMAVMYSFREVYGSHDRSLSFSRWLASIPAGRVVALFIAIIVLYPVIAHAQSGAEGASPIGILFRWMPLLLTTGFALNILISFITMLFGTIAGVLLGLGQISPNPFIRRPSKAIVLTFQNSPWLVVIFIVMLSMPNEISLFGTVVNFPDWIKAVLGLTLPVMANVAEVVRGGIISVPSAQWEAAEALAFTRQQTLWRIILPQCIKRMIPPWMNWYAILTMTTPLVSILGVGELVTTTRLAMAAENDNPALLFPFFGFCLVTFFIYCYPIARLTIRLEQRFTVKL